MNVTIRAVTNDDYQDLHAVYTCPGVVRNTSGLPYVSLDFWKERTENRSPNRHVLVAEVDSRVVGSINLHCGVNRMVHSAGFGMGIHDDFQGQGIGTQLMAAMVDLAENWLNIRRIELQVFTDNDPAVALYNKFGFEVEATHRDLVFRDGEYGDAYTMARFRDGEQAG